MNKRPEYSNMGAVVVAYHPDEEFSDRLRVVSKELRTVVVDNSGEDSAEAVNVLCEELGVELITNKTNLGLAAALNTGLEWAREHNLKWLVLLDQDSIARDGLVGEMGAVYDNLPQPEQVALIGSNYVERTTGAVYHPITDVASGDWVETQSVITSGTLLSLDAADIIGRFREDFFVDLVDHEYCLRARAKGFKIVLALTPLIEHAIGTPTPCRVLGRNLTTPNANPSRYYYRTRNLLVLAREYLFRDPKWVIDSFITRTKEVVLMLLCERDRLAKTRAIMRGTLDALLRKMGPIH